MKNSLLAASMMALMLCAKTASATALQCTVVGVTDGDTLTCLTIQKHQIKVRLAEIDTPERAQPPRKRSVTWSSGKMLNYMDRRAIVMAGKWPPWSLMARASTKPWSRKGTPGHIGIT